LVQTDEERRKWYREYRKRPEIERWWDESFDLIDDWNKFTSDN